MDDTAEDTAEFWGLTNAILAEIDAAFAGASREGGMSWSQSKVADNYGDEKEYATAGAMDRDRDWHEVAADSDWRLESGIGGFSFLDPIGYRYYLPAAMTVAARTGQDERLVYALTLSDRSDLREYGLQQWSLLNHRQRLCVRHFIEHMVQLYRLANRPFWNEEIYADEWELALNSYWHSIPDEDPSPPEKPMAKHRNRKKRSTTNRF